MLRCLSMTESKTSTQIHPSPSFISSKSRRILAFLALTVAAVLWGSSFLVIQETMTHDIWFMLAVRHLIGGFGVLLIFRNRALRWDKKNSKLWWWIGFLILLTFAPQSIGLQGTSVSNSAVITALFVVLTPVAMVITKNGHPSFMQWIGSLIGFFAFALMGWLQGFSSLNVYDGLTFVTAVAVAFHTVAFARAIRDERFTYAVVAFQFFISAGLLLAIHFLLVAKGASSILPDLSTREWLGLLYLGFFSMSIPYALQAFGQLTLSPITAVLVISSEPLWAMGVANIFRGDVLSGAAVLASCILLVANFVAEIRWKHSK